MMVSDLSFKLWITLYSLLSRGFFFSIESNRILLFGIELDSTPFGLKLMLGKIIKRNCVIKMRKKL